MSIHKTNTSIYVPIWVLDELDRVAREKGIRRNTIIAETLVKLVAYADPNNIKQTEPASV